ncbi:nicotinate-nucleotide--dimethylbenzimidazole phosphoribosyltransferase, partial [Piscinibacter sakaiensis]|uniref:nicotinate-nucleotide--dimethylbenzimidazole phosphoribosyltransferase n=1 Tax=Piscinibacter sakaiensis TaxID=1547922 RepID=UPI0006B696FB
LPLSAFAHQAGIGLSVVDCGVAEAVTPHARLVARKIAHGSRSVRLGPAMSVAQAHAGIRAGMELAEALPGNVLMCAGLGAGGFESGALVIARLAATDLRPLVQGGDASPADRVARLMVVLQTALERHRAATHPVEVLAALGGHEMSLMVGAMLVAASRRHLVVLDGMAACAAFHVATRLAPETRPYGLFCHSHGHPGLQRAQALLDGGPMLELGLNSQDGTGAVLAWPLIRSAAALLAEVAEPDEAPRTAGPLQAAMA